MKLNSQFRVAAAPSVVWPLLNDVERIAPCMPGAELRGRDGDTYSGRMMIKLGPISSSMEGTMEMTERSDADRRIVIKAVGRDQKNQGGAQGLITALVTPDPADEASSLCVIEGDIAITGRLGQFARGLINDVAQQVIDQFAENLQALIEAGGAQEANGSTTSSAIGGGQSRGGGAAMPAAALDIPLGRVLARLHWIPWLVAVALVLRALRRRRKARS